MLMMGIDDGFASVRWGLLDTFGNVMRSSRVSTSFARACKPLVCVGKVDKWPSYERDDLSTIG